MTTGNMAQTVELNLSRRTFLKGTAGLFVAFSLFGPTRALAAPARQGAPADTLDSWLSIAPDGKVTLFVGRVELGTGVETAFAQIAAEELDVPFGWMSVVQGDTARTVDQGSTVGSTAISAAGPAIRNAAAAARQTLIELAAERLGLPAEQLTVQDGVVQSTIDPSKQVSYAQLVGGQRLEIQVDSVDITLKPPSAYTIVGQPIPRMDIPAKMTGRFEYVQNVRVPGMLHARVVRPPAQSGAKVVSVDESSVADVPGLVKISAHEGWVGVVAQREEQAIRAAQQLQVTWSEGTPLPSPGDLFSVIRALPGQDRVLSEEGDVDEALAGAARRVQASYEFPPQSHGMIGPVCAVADVQSDRATIWSGTQYPHALARSAAGWLGLEPASVRVMYAEGSGCYGRYTTDDAALEAALLSKEVGRPVRMQWMRHDEHGWDHYSPPMAFDVRGGLDAQGNVVAWDYEVWSPSHVAQPYLGDLTGLPWSTPNFVGDDTQHSYGWENQRLLLHALSQSVLRYGNLRSLGAMMSAFASESFVDELAAAAGVDPVEFRLRYLTDPRAISALQAAAGQAGWQSRPSASSVDRSADVVTGRGVSVGEYGVGASGATWVAMIADVEVNRSDGHVRATRITVAHDCGLIINPDGVRNQIEGNVIQSISRSLLEEVHFDESGVLIKDWQTYPILTFPEIPEIDIVLLNRPDLPAIGAGEPATIPTGAALANAIFDATGLRLRRIPFTAARVKAALEA